MGLKDLARSHLYGYLHCGFCCFTFAVITTEKCTWNPLLPKALSYRIKGQLISKRHAKHFSFKPWEGRIVLMALYEMERMLQHQKHPVTCSSYKFCICDFLIQKQLAVSQKDTEKPRLRNFTHRTVLPVKITNFCNFYHSVLPQKRTVTYLKRINNMVLVPWQQKLCIQPLKALVLLLFLLLFDTIHRHYLYSLRTSVVEHSPSV